MLSHCSHSMLYVAFVYTKKLAIIVSKLLKLFCSLQCIMKIKIKTKHDFFLKLKKSFEDDSIP